MKRETAIEETIQTRRRFLACALLPAAAARLGPMLSSVGSSPELDRLERVLHEHGSELGELRRLSPDK